MTDEERLGFREWTTHYEKEQEADRDKINSVVESVGQLSGVVHRMSAVVESVAENQKATFSRLNRPWQWGVVISVFMALFSMAAMFSVVASLIVGPINAGQARAERTHARDVERNLELHMWFRETIAGMQVGDAEAKANIAWLLKMEERLNNRLHAGMGE